MEKKKINPNSVHSRQHMLDYTQVSYITTEYYCYRNTFSHSHMFITTSLSSVWNCTSLIRPYYRSLGSTLLQVSSFSIRCLKAHLISHFSLPFPALIYLSHVSHLRVYPRTRSMPHAPVHPPSWFHDLIFKLKLVSCYHLEFEGDVSISIIFIVYLRLLQNDLI